MPDYPTWTLDGHKVFTVLSREADPATACEGLFLRQYDVSGQQAALSRTYRNSVFCGNAGAVDVSSLRPRLRPVRGADDAPPVFVLAYVLACRPEEAGGDVAMVDAVSGIPAVRLVAMMGEG